MKFAMRIDAFGLFRHMRKLGLELDAFTVLDLVRACGNFLLIEEGRCCMGIT